MERHKLTLCCGKHVLCRIIIDSVRSGVDDRLSKEQAGYRKGRGTSEQVFILRNIIEQVNAGWQATIYLNFIDFEEEFDSIHRERMWAIMKKYGVPEMIIRMVQIFYEDFKCAVEDQGEIGEWFDIKIGVKQGCNVWFLIVMGGLGNERDRWSCLEWY